MHKTGGIIGIIAGVFSVIAAVVTLIFGGVATAFNSSGASTVVGLGWGGVFFSFLVIVFSSLSFSKPKLAGKGMIVSSILGMILGGTIVAIFMLLSLVGGILSLRGQVPESSKLETPVLVSSSTAETVSTGVKAPWGKRVIIGFAVLFVLAVAGRFLRSMSASSQPATLTIAERKNEIEKITVAEDSKIVPKTFTEWADSVDGPVDVYDKLTGANKETTLQKQKRAENLQENLAAAKGKIIVWEVIVGDIKENENGYLLKNKCKAPGPKLFMMQQEQPFIEATLTALNTEDKKAIESLVACNVIKIKGKIAGYNKDGKIYIEPAILLESHNYKAEAIASPNSPNKPEVVPLGDISEKTHPAPDLSPQQVHSVPSTEEETKKDDVEQSSDKTAPQILSNSKSEEFSLPALDADLNRTYKTVMSNLDAAKRNELKKQEIAWIKTKDQECGTDQSCLKRLTEKRLQELKELNGQVRQ